MHFIDIKSNIPDGEAHVMPDGKIYLYGSLDEHKRKWCSDKYKVIFSSDLEKWEENDIYYYVFADIVNGKPTSLGYATSKSPLGPFAYQGIIVDNIYFNPQSWNNHGSIEEFNGKWYVFFHASTKGKYKRRACIAPIEFDENGLIRGVTR